MEKDRQSPAANPLKRLDELKDLDQKERLKEQLRILDTLMKQANARGDSAGALRFFQEATALLRRA